jgi:hypothetical protein
MATVFEPIRPVPPMTTIFMFTSLADTRSLKSGSNATQENICASLHVYA